jgi:phage tail sheath protein FI
MTTYGRPGVYITERLLAAPIASAGTAVAAGAALGAFPQGPSTLTLVSSWYEFTQKFGGYNNAYPASFGVGQFFQNGGGELYVARVLAADAAFAGVIVPSTNILEDSCTITANNLGEDSNNLRVQITASTTANYYDLTVYKETVAGTGSNVTNDLVLERYTNVVFNNANSSDFVETVINNQSDYIKVFVSDITGTPSAAVLPLIGGSDGTDPADADFNGAISQLSSLNRPLVVFLPGLLESIGAVSAAGVYNSCIAWAEDEMGFVITETADSLSVSDALAYAGTISDSSQAAAYFPHYFISDPLGRSPQSIRKVGPAGAIAGLFLSTDRQYGPFKAPAGTRASLSGALALETAFTSTELDSLNSSASPLNAIRNLPGAGIVVMGARTLKQDGTANKYVNMRRSLIYIKKQLNDLTTFALFENNDEVLWARIRASVAVFLGEYRNQGGLRGATEDAAFYVKVDAENNSTSTIQLGEVHIEVGVALQYPAEFVVINLSQTTAA